MSGGVARLLAESEWTDRELGERLGKAHQWISQQKTFGRFLELATMVAKDESAANSILATMVAKDESAANSILATMVDKITERRFRTLYNQTDKEEPEEARFAEVLHLLEEGAADSKVSRALAGKLVERFADGKWHPLDSM